MPARSKFLVLLAIFLSSSYANSFLSMNQVAGDQVQVNHFIQFEETNKPNHDSFHDSIINLNGQTSNQTKQQLEQDALLPDNLSSKRVLFQVSLMDDVIQTCKTHSEYTQSYQVAILVPFISFRSKNFGLAYCWVHSHWKTTVDLFQALHSIQFACIKRSFTCARVLISTFDGSTLSSTMAC